MLFFKKVLLIGIPLIEAVLGSPSGHLLAGSSPTSLLSRGLGLVKRNGISFPSDSQCTADQVATIRSAYKDALSLSSWSYRTSSGAKFVDLRGRYFGTDKVEGTPERKAVENVFYKISRWYPYWFGDWFWGTYIATSCNDKENVCRINSDGKRPGAYARNPSTGPLIVMCQLFFDNAVAGGAFVTLTDRLSYLRANPSQQRKCSAYINRGQIFLHEMVHLNVISGTPGIPDFRGDSGYVYYGPYRTEGLAIRQPVNARNNADNYAMYTNANWFSYYFGDCDIPRSSNGISVTDAQEDENDIPFPGVPTPYYFEDESVTGSSTFQPQGYPEDDADSIALDNFIVSFTTPDGAPYPDSITGKNLRILPLGDSITQGFQSSDANGYRQDLVTLLRPGNTVEMVGEFTSGTGADNHEQGTDGAEIAQIAATASGALALRPNVVLLHAGTNDCNNNADPAGAPARLSSLIDQIFATCPDAVILIAEIIGSIQTMVEGRIEQGQHLVYVPLGHALLPAQYADSLHPNNEGYQTMATYWYDSLVVASERGYISDPVKPDTGSSECAKLPTWIDQGEIATGAGLGQNYYVGQICAPFPNDEDCDNCRCLCQAEVGETGTGGGDSVTVYRNGLNCTTDLHHYTTAAVHFADLNNDGRAEYLWVDDKGGVTAFQNNGYTYENSTSGSVYWIPKGKIAGGLGNRRDQIRFADINGDGRAEYLIVADDGAVHMYLNEPGADDPSDISKIVWVDQGIIASGIGKDGEGVRFADLNGDGRAEYLWVGQDSSVTAYLNGGWTYIDGQHGSVVWIEQDVIATGVGATRENIFFGDMNGDGRADYLEVSHVDGSVKLWTNQGGPDDGPNAARVGWWERGEIATGIGNSGLGVQFGDLNGDGRVEYLDVNSDTSAVVAYLNAC